MNGNQALLTGTNYFWLVYDLAETPTPGDVIDACSIQFVMSGTGGSKNAANSCPPGNALVNLEYCIPPQSVNYYGELSVYNISTTGGITNFNSTPEAYNNNAYANYSTTHIASQAQNSSITVNLGYYYAYDLQFYAFVDYNDNGVFTDPGELVFGTTSYVEGTVSSTFTIPADARPGTHRMRIRADGYRIDEPCSQLQYGETDDYGLTVIAGCTSPPTAPGPLNGFVNVCRYINSATQLTYSVPPIPGATFAWIVPPATTLLSGQGTNSIVLLINTGFADDPNKQIRVSATSSCGAGPTAVFYLRAQIAAVPSPITATSTNVCPIIGTGNTYTFTIASVAGASSYLWAGQDATTVITHPNGNAEEDTTVTVSFTNSFTTSAITVRSVNGCGVSNTRSLTLVKNDPAMTGLITGPTNVCAYTAPNGVVATYSVSNIAGNTYNWTVPLNATGLTGQGTNSISFLYPPGFTTGAVSVSTTTGCGTSPARILQVNRLNAATPGAIDVISLGNCPERLYSYTIAAMPANTVSLQWTIPAGAVLQSGQGTASITLAYPLASLQGIITVQAVNNCSISSTRSVQVKLPACATERAEPIYVRAGNKSNGNVRTTAPAVDKAEDKLSGLQIYPNPNNGNFIVYFHLAEKINAPVKFELIDITGKMVYSQNTMIYNGLLQQTIALSSMVARGVYTAKIIANNKSYITKMLYRK